MATDDGIEYSRGYGDQCLTCHSRDIGYVSSEGRRFCKNCQRIAALEAQLAESADKLRHAEAEIDRLIDENVALQDRVNVLARDRDGLRVLYEDSQRLGPDEAQRLLERAEQAEAALAKRDARGSL